MGVLESVKQVVFIVDTSSALSGIFNMLLTNYIVPCVEHFNGGPVKGIELPQSPGNGNQYGLVTINPSPLFSVPSCDYWPITNSAKTLMHYFRNIKFEGGLIEHSCRVSDGLAAALEFLDLMEKFVQKSSDSSDDVKFERYCVLVTNLPPSPMPVVESLKFGSMTYLQVAEHMSDVKINLSIISPRWLSPYKELFLKSSQSVDIGDADHGLHPGCMVLLNGLELNSIKSLKVKADPAVTTSSGGIMPESSLIPPSPSVSSTTPGSVGAVSQAAAIPTNTPSPIQLSDLQTSATLNIDKSPLTKASSSSSLPTDTQHPWHLGNSPKVPSNPASVSSIPSSSGLTTTHGMNEVVQSLPPISHTPSPQSVASPQRQNITTSLHSSSSASQPSSFPLQSSSTSSNPGAATATSFSGTLNLMPNDDLGTVSNPIQITSPSADGGLNFHPSSTHSGAGGLMSLLSPSTASSTSLTSPPFSFSSSDLPSISASALDSTPSAPQSSVSNISSLLMTSSSMQPASAPLSSSAGGIRPPLSTSQALTPPPSTSQPVPPPQGPAAIAAQILLQATQQANNSKPPQMVGPGSNVQPPPPVNSNNVTVTVPNAVAAASNDGSGFMQQQQQQQPSSSLTSNLNQPNTAQPVNTGGNIVPNQMNPLQQPLPPHPSQTNQQPGPLQSMPQTQIWSGLLETYEPRGNNPRHLRPVQCSILISKPDIAQEIKPETWPSKLTMNTYSKNLFNTFTAFFRNHQSHLRTVHFQFMERPENVTMLRSLMNNDLPQNKKIGIIQLNGSLPQCPIKAFFMICQEKSQIKQFTGLIPLDQEKFISTLKQALAVQSRQPQGAQIQRAGLPSNLVGTNPMMAQQHMAAQQQQQQQGSAGGGSMGGGGPVGGNQQQMMNNTMDSQNTAFNQGAGVGGVANNTMFMSGQQQNNYSSMMSSQSTSAQQQQFSMTAGGGAQQQQQSMLQQQQIRSNLQMGGGQQQQMQPGQQSIGGGQQLGGQQLGGQMQQLTSSITQQQQQQLKQVLENATPEKRQMIYAKLEQHKLEQQRAMRLQQQQQQYQQNQMYGGGGGSGMQPQQPGQQPMNRQPNQQQMAAAGTGGMPPTQQPPPSGTSGGTAGGTGPPGGTTGPTLDFFQSF